METEILETLFLNSTMTWLSAQEDFSTTNKLTTENSYAHSISGARSTLKKKKTTEEHKYKIKKNLTTELTHISGLKTSVYMTLNKSSNSSFNGTLRS
jgi:hypothetical protein